MARISIDREKIADFCRRHYISRLSLFGSVLREDFGPASDVDVLVEFEPGSSPAILQDWLFSLWKKSCLRLSGERWILTHPNS
jgi:predicted nucleotidyltransferase